MTEEEVEFVLSAIGWVASYGHLFLGLYDFDWKTGNWSCICSLDCATKPNAVIADGFISSYCPGDAGRRLRFRRPLQMARALSHALPPESSSARPIPKYIDARVVLFRV
jgi:hypothetical protein